MFKLLAQTLSDIKKNTILNISTITTLFFFCLFFPPVLTDLLHGKIPEPGYKAGWAISREMGGIACHKITQDHSVLCWP